MAGPLYTGPSGESIRNFGSAIANIGLTIFDKLNAAEIASQTKIGMQMLNSEMAKFDSEIEKNPDPSTYINLNRQAQDRAWTAVESSIQNQGAKNVLNDWWNSTTLQRERAVENKSTMIRIRNVQDQYTTLMGQYAKEGGEEGKAKAQELVNQMVETNIISPAQGESDKANVIKKIDTNTILNTGIELMGSVGQLPAIGQMIKMGKEAGFDSFETKSLIDTATESFNLTMRIQDNQAAATNSKVRSEYIDKLMTDSEAINKVKLVDIQSDPRWASSTNVDPGDEKMFVYNLYAKVIKENAPGPSVKNLLYSWEVSDKSLAKRQEILAMVNEGNYTDEDYSKVSSAMKIEGADSVLVPYYDKWDSSEQTEADRIAIKEEFSQAPGRTDSQVVQLDNYLDPSKARKKPLTDDEQDDLLKPMLDKFLREEVKQTDEQKQAYAAAATKMPGVNSSAVFRFISRMETARSLTDAEKAQLGILGILPGDSMERRDAASRAYATMMTLLQQNPDWSKEPGRIQREALNQLDVEIRSYIKKDLSGITTGGNLGDFLSNVFGGAKEKKAAGDLVQSGRVSAAAAAVSKTAGDFTANFDKAVKENWIKKYPRSGEPLFQADPPKRTTGKFSGLRPMTEFYVPTERKIYQVWMDEKGVYNYYSLPESQYTANALNGDAWKLEK